MFEIPVCALCVSFMFALYVSVLCLRVTSEIYVWDSCLRFMFAIYVGDYCLRFMSEIMFDGYVWDLCCRFMCDIKLCLRFMFELYVWGSCLRVMLEISVSFMFGIYVWDKWPKLKTTNMIHVTSILYGKNGRSPHTPSVLCRFYASLSMGCSGVWIVPLLKELPIYSIMRVICPWVASLRDSCWAALARLG